MTDKGPKILLTGVPGCGKTTLIRRVVEALDRPATGFYTSEMRPPGGRRTGFTIVTLDGREGVLAEAGFGGRYQVGRYRVNLDSVESLAVGSMIPEDGDQLVVVDEVGKMECLSTAFCDAVERMLDGPNPVLGTVAVRGSEFIRRTRGRPDVTLVEVTPANRDRLVTELIRVIGL